jgi:hypothetical protein
MFPHQPFVWKTDVLPARADPETERKMVVAQRVATGGFVQKLVRPKFAVPPLRRNL